MISSNKAKGFTLVELLIVIVVIGILAAISIVAYNGVTQKARDDERISDARNIVNAISAYNSENEGAWLTASDGDKTKLKGYNTVKVPAKAVDKLSENTVDKDHYKLEPCGSPQTGVKISIWNEAKGTVHTETYTAGSGC
ncbi:MAG: type II secretion system protein [Candidatus Saccharibacteria bacterium]|nr:type II secretion system protein [Candidatus Saccharibacteria bacterium]